MKRGAALATIIVVVAAAFLLLTLPPRRIAALAPFSDGTIPGNLHIHTTRSDGRNTPDEVAAIAARAGLKFIVFTDHGDATRVPDAPIYRSGVLCLDGVEISTTGGHFVALGMPAAPYPLAGEPRDVAEDVRRLGGFGVAAHPDSPKPGLRWLDWTVPLDGVEWINPDTSWRILAASGWRARFGLANALIHYPIRPGETLANLLMPFDDTMTRWNALAGQRRVVILSGVDAHAKLASRNAASGDNRYTLALPSYEALFSLLSVHVRTDRAFSGDAAGDAALLMGAIRAGHLYTALDGLATPPSFELTATNANGTVREGDELAAGGPVSLRARSNAPPGFTTRIWQGTKILAAGGTSDLVVQAGDQPAVYRAEIRTSGPTSRTWLLSNAIYVRAATGQSPLPGPARPTATTSVPVLDPRPTGGWHVEASPESSGLMETRGDQASFELQLRYALPEHWPVGASAAMVWWPDAAASAGKMSAYDRLTFSARAEHPMRISVQLRAPAPDGRPPRRWQRSIYLSTVEGAHTIYFDELVPSPNTQPPEPPPHEVNAVMFVVDTVNTKPGSSGRVWIRNVALQK